MSKGLNFIKNIKSNSSTYVLNDYQFTLGDIGLIYGNKNSKKSTLAVQLALDLAAGKQETFGHIKINRKQRVLFVSLENGLEPMKACITGYEAAGNQPPSDDDFHALIYGSSDPDDAAEVNALIDGNIAFFLDWLEGKVKAGFTQIFIDNLACLPKLNVESASSTVGLLLGAKNRMKDKACLWLIQHTPTGGGKARGSKRLMDLSQCIFYLWQSIFGLVLKNQGKVHPKPAYRPPLDGKADVGFVPSRDENARYLIEWYANYRFSPEGMYAGLGFEFVKEAEKKAIEAYINWLHDEDYLQGDEYGTPTTRVFETISKGGALRNPLITFNKGQGTWSGVMYAYMRDNTIHNLDPVHNEKDAAMRLFAEYNKTIQDPAKRLTIW